MIGISELAVASAPSVLVCLGLGSCIGLAMVDVSLGLGGVAHIMLPETFPDRDDHKPAKFADRAVAALRDELVRQGANPRRLAAAYAGGAQVFQFGATNAKLDVGGRNAAAVAAQIARLQIRVLGADVGGRVGRTMTVRLMEEVKVRSVQSQERVLCRLR